MIKSVNLLNILKDSLNKEEILEQDLRKIEDLTLNQYKLNGMVNDIDLKELEFFKNLKTLTLINFSIDTNILKNINDNKFLWAIQFSRCKFEDLLPINQEISNLIIDNCKNIKYELINNNKIIKIIGSTVDLNQLTRLYNTESLYLQDCNIKNVNVILKYTKLKYLNLDGSIVDDDNILRKLNKNIQICYKKEYHLLGE